LRSAGGDDVGVVDESVDHGGRDDLTMYRAPATRDPTTTRATTARISGKPQTTPLARSYRSRAVSSDDPASKNMDIGWASWFAR